MIKLEILDLHHFSSHYQRNNKAKGRKNLRCFPCCRADGHKTNRYCGRPVRAVIKIESNALEVSLADVAGSSGRRVASECFSLDLSKFTCILGREGGTCDPQFYKENNPEQEIIVQVHSHLHPRGGRCGLVERESLVVTRNHASRS